MPLVEHLRELRGRLGKAVLAVIAGAVFGFVFYEQIWDVLKRPACDLPGNITTIGEGPCGTLTITGALTPFSLQLKVALVVGLLIASPVWLYQLWAFVAPGLHRREKRWGISLVAVGAPLFIAGAVAVYLILPKAIPLLLGFTPADVANNLPVDQYLDFVVRLIVVFGLAFELPLFLALLTLAGIVDAAKLRSWWRIAVFVIFVFSAVATPTGDPLTMSALAIPMVILYFAAVGFAMIVDRRRARSSTEQWADDETSDLDTTPSPLDDPEPPDDGDGDGDDGDGDDGDRHDGGGTSDDRDIT